MAGFPVGWVIGSATCTDDRRPGLSHNIFRYFSVYLRFFTVLVVSEGRFCLRTGVSLLIQLLDYLFNTFLVFLTTFRSEAYIETVQARVKNIANVDFKAAKTLFLKMFFIRNII